MRALEISKALYPSFPLDNKSNSIIALILGLFITLAKFVKTKSKKIIEEREK